MAVSTGGEPINALRIKPTKKTANNKVSARERSVRSSKWGFRLVSLIRVCVPSVGLWNVMLSGWSMR